MADGVEKAVQRIYEKEDITCGICQEKPCHPKLLSCYHPYCSDCLQRYIDTNRDQGNVKCPLCRRIIEITSDGILVGVSDLFVKMTFEEVSKCEVCETSQAASFCLECTQNYCQTCTDIHSKIKYTREHHTVPNGKIPLQNKKRSASFCTKHGTEPLHYFCMDCKEPICFKCNMTTHKKHRCEDITSVAESKRKCEVQEGLEKVTYRIKILEERLQKCKYKRQSVQDKCQKETEMMMEHVNTRINKAISNALRENVNKYVKGIQTTEGDIQNELRALRAKSSYIQQYIDFAGDAELVNILPGLDDGPLMRDGFIWLEENANIEYSPPSVSDDEIRKMIGVPSMRFALSSPIKIEKQFEFKVEKCIKGICGISPDTVWVAYGQCIQKFIKHRGACEKVDMGEDVFDVVKDIVGEIYVACKSSIRLVNADLNVVKCFNLPLCPSGIAVSEDIKIYVCFEDAGRINMYSKEGKPCMELHKDSCQGMASHPLKVAIYFEEIFVIDSYFSKGDVIVISLEGVVRNKFKQGDMDPRGLAISRQGHVFVADNKNKCILIFNQQGIYLSTLNTNINSNNIFIVTENELWIGDNAGNIHVLRLVA